MNFIILRNVTPGAAIQACTIKIHCIESINIIIVYLFCDVKDNTVMKEIILKKWQAAYDNIVGE